MVAILSSEFKTQSVLAGRLTQPEVKQLPQLSSWSGEKGNDRRLLLLPFLFTQPRIPFREWCHLARVGHPTAVNVTKRILHRLSWRLNNLHSPSQACLLGAKVTRKTRHYI